MRNNSVRPIVTALAFLTLTAGVAPQKVSKETLSSGGQQRTYYKFIPEGADQVPLIVLLHGSGRDGTTLINPWESLAKKERIALVAPDATVKQAWNIGRDGPYFFRDLVEAMRATGRIDARRIYLFGHSAGGHHSIDMGLLESEYFAAVAVHAGALTHDQELMTGQADRKIPMAMWNGTHDNVVVIDAVRQVREYLVGKGFSVKLTEIPNHTHDYYSRASDINRAAWEFLKAHQLTADPKFKDYIITK
jgi:poly(3-hydroxybutyrate) depolymerase